MIQLNTKSMKVILQENEQPVSVLLYTLNNLRNFFESTY